MGKPKTETQKIIEAIYKTNESISKLVDLTASIGKTLVVLNDKIVKLQEENKTLKTLLNRK